MSTQQLQLPVTSSTLPSCYTSRSTHKLTFRHHSLCSRSTLCRGKTFEANALGLPPIVIHNGWWRQRRRRPSTGLTFVGTGETEVLGGNEDNSETAAAATSGDEEEEDEQEATPEDLECVGQIKRVLELLKKNRDMLFGEVKLTVLIEDPREVERRRLLGIDDSDAPSREDLVEALEDVNEGRIPKDRIALKMLAEEMINWPNLEVELPKTKAKSKSPYAKATDTGVDPQVAAKRLNMDWDTAAEIEDSDDKNDTEVPQAVGYGALYLVTAFPVIIGISVVLILFYNSLQ